MHNNKISPGLRHFDETQCDFFFGRNRQVDDLLSIIQESRFIGVVGPEGTGKTSLVLSGLIPAIKKGFNGVAGKEWSICYCRPGITPIENLAAALSERYVLRDQEKGSLEFHDDIVKLIRRDHSGIINGVSGADISSDTNLLLVIDQFEDIFDHLSNKNKSVTSWEQDISLYLNNIVKAVSTHNAAIYVLIIMQSDFIPSLYNFRVLHEFISKGLYAIPLFRQDDFQQIIKGSVDLAGYQISEEAVELLENKFNQDLRNLPVLQLLLSKLTNPELNSDLSQTKKINVKDITKFGEFEQLVQRDLNQYFHELPPQDQLIVEQLFRNITQPGEGLSIKKPQSLREIIDVTGIERSELIRVIAEMNRSQQGILDIIEPFQKKVTHFKEANISDSAVINLSNNYLIKNWGNLNSWIEDERASIEVYMRLSESAKLFEQNQTGYLRPPDLDLVKNWYEKVEPKKIWADQFNSQYRMAIDYLLRSSEKYTEEVEQKESEQKEKLRKAKRFQLFMLTVSGIFFTLFLFMIALREEAVKAKKEAIKYADAAQVSKIKAESSANEALKAKDLADKNAEKAREEEKKAKINQELAREAEIKAVQETNKAKSAESKAKASNEAAIKSAAIAKKEEKSAKEAGEREKIARKNERDRAEYEAAGKKIMSLWNRSITEDFQQEKERRDFAKEVIDAYMAFDSSSRNVYQGKVLPDNTMFRLLTDTEWKIVANKSKITESSKNVIVELPNGIRDIDIFQGDKIIAGGDDKILVYYQLSGTLKKYPTVKNLKRIRSVKFVDANRIVFGNVVGEIYLFNLTTKEEKLIDVNNLDQAVNSIVVQNDKLFTNYGGNLIQLQMSSLQKSLLPIKKVEQIFEMNDEKILIKSSEGLFLLDSKSSDIQKINIGGQLPKVSAVAISKELTFLGTEDGKIWIYENQKGSLQNLINPWTISAHRTKVTALKYDEKSKQLFTASLDQMSKIYDFSLDDRQKTQNLVVKLEGFKKWIWDFELEPSKDHGAELFTVDEEGFLMRWKTQPADLFEEIENWQKKITAKK